MFYFNIKLIKCYNKCVLAIQFTATWFTFRTNHSGGSQVLPSCFPHQVERLWLALSTLTSYRNNVTSYTYLDKTFKLFYLLAVNIKLTRVSLSRSVLVQSA